MDYEIMYFKVRTLLKKREDSLSEIASFWRERYKENPEDPIYKTMYDHRLCEWAQVRDLIREIEKIEESEDQQDYTHYIATGTEGEVLEWTTKE